MGLQMVGSLLHLALTPTPDFWYLPHSSSAASSAEGLPSRPCLPSRSVDSGFFLSGWSVSVSLSTLLSDQPRDSSTLPAGHPGPAASLRVTLEFPSLPKDNPRPGWVPQLLTNTATSFLSSCPFSLPIPFFLPTTSLPLYELVTLTMTYSVPQFPQLSLLTQG